MSGFCSELVTLAGLKDQVIGKVILQGDALYLPKITRYWNGRLHRLRPLGFVEVHCEADVVATVKYCTLHKLPLCIVSGGHGDASLVDDAVVLDFSELKTVVVDAKKKLLIAEPGANVSNVDIQSLKYQLAVTTGTLSTVGIGGQALELGVGFLARRFGYLIDNISKYELVLVNGEKIVVSEESNADLFWALKGYGANFGIVTKFHIKLHDFHPEVLGGNCYFSWEDAKKVIAHACQFQDNFAILREMTLVTMFHISTTGYQVFYRFLFAGDHSEGREIINRLLSSCPAKCLYNTVESMPYDVFQRSCDGLYDHGRMSYLHPGHFLTEISDAYIDNLIEAFSSLKLGENTNSTAYVEPVGGVITDIPEESSPFLYRSARFWVGIVGAARSEAGYITTSDVMNEWARRGESYAMKIDVEKEREVWTRLKGVKRKYDPNNVLRCNACNVNPSS